MINKISDLYTALPGDKLILNKSTTIIPDVYTEAFAQNKWISIDPHLINSTWIVEILNPDQIRNADITNQIIGSELQCIDEDNSKVVMELPDHIKVNSLQTRIYKVCKGYSVRFFERYLIMSKKLTLQAKSIITDDFNKKDDIKVFKKAGISNIPSTLTSLYKSARNAGITISINNHPGELLVTHKGEYYKNSRPFATLIKEWLKELPYDMTVKIPKRFTDIKPLIYINTVINKSKYVCTVAGGEITKRSVGLRKSEGKIILVVNEEVKLTINKASVTHLSTKDRNDIDKTLEPYGKSYKDAR